MSLSALGVLFALLAASGAVLRFEIGRRLNSEGSFPFGTLLVNVTGAFLAGLLATLSGPLAAVVAMGLVGAYTTVSGFAGEVVTLVIARRWLLAAIYLLSSAGLPVGAAWLGLALTR